MRLTGKALIGVLVLCATGLSWADGLEWVARGARATLVPGGASGTTPVYVCRAAVGSLVAVGEFASDRSGECRVAVNGGEHAAVEFELLAQAARADVRFTWVPGHAAGYAQNAVVAGRPVDGQRTLVCAAVNMADGSVRPGYIADENCVYAADGVARVAETYLVLVSDDPSVARTEEAQPAAEGFNPNAILAINGVANLCAQGDGLCAPEAPH